jgi:hypothetical protein
MTAATRKTGTRANGGSGNGDIFTEALLAEISNLWGLVPEYLANVSGTNTILATSDTTIVSAVLAVARPKSFWLVPAVTNTATVTLNVNSIGAKAIVDKDGNALSAGALIAGRLYHLMFDGTSFRIVNSVGGSGAPASVTAVNNGRLSLATGVYAPSTGITAATSAYWVPGGHGNQIALYDGISTWTLVASAEKSIKITDAAQSGATHNGNGIIDGLTDTSQLIPGMKVSGTNVGGGAVISTIDSATQVTVSVNSTGSATNTITFKLPASSVFDVFGFIASNALKLEFCAWTNSTTRAVALTTQDGIAVKSGTLGGTGATVVAGTRRYLGTLATTTTDGQSEFSFGAAGAGGTAANLLLFNQDNRVNVAASVADNNVSWTYAGGAWRQADNSAGNRINFVLGVAEDAVRADACAGATNSGTGAVAGTAIGLDSATVPTGLTGFGQVVGNTSMTGRYAGNPGVGLHYLQALEYATAATITFYGLNVGLQTGISALLRM